VRFENPAFASARQEFATDGKRIYYTADDPAERHQGDGGTALDGPAITWVAAHLCAKCVPPKDHHVSLRVHRHAGAWLLDMAEHAGEHLGQLIAYARVNGVKPPWSK
jgi:hypothetical protein